jgi:hypothetical protein
VIAEDAEFTVPAKRQRTPVITELLLRPAGPPLRYQPGDHHRRLARAQQPFQAQRGVHPAVAVADNQDPWPTIHHFLHYH